MSITEEEILELRESYRRCISKEVFWDDFYESLMGASEEIKILFSKTDFVRQKKIIAESLVYVFIYAQDNNSKLAQDVLTHIGKSHDKNGLNIKKEMFQIWLETLLGNIQKHDQLCSEELINNWKGCLQKSIDYILSHGDYN